MPSAARALRGFYAILDVKGHVLPDPAALEARARALLAGAPCMLQLRAKGLGGGDLCVASRALLPSCRAAGVPFCVNDRLDVALAVGADAVHVGQDDLPLADVLRLVDARVGAGGRRPLVGVSTHGLAQARAAVAGGADYIGFGPVFGTRTKANPDPVVGLGGLREACAAVAVPVVAIGGITRASLPEVVAAGAAAAAVIGDIELSENPAVAAREVAAAFVAS
jgi:thiamine-phosphate pyrophosphorylase